MSKPKISVNKLGEYINATPARRKRIVEQQKEPMPFIVTRYTLAREAMVNYVISKFDKSIIENALIEVSDKETNSDFQINDKETSIDALKKLSQIQFPDLTNFEIIPFKGNGKLDIFGVDVSVMPDIIFRGVLRKKNIVGAIKFHIAKTSPLDEESRKNVATILHQFVEERLTQTGEKAPLNLCFSVDIFLTKCEHAPKTYKNRRTQINASCEEYALWWDKL